MNFKTQKSNNSQKIKVSGLKSSDSLMGFDKELEEIEREIKEIKEDYFYYNKLEMLGFLNARKSQLLKDKEIVKEFIRRLEDYSEEINGRSYISIARVQGFAKEMGVK